MATQTDNNRMKLIGVAVGVLLLALVGYSFIGSDAGATSQPNVSRELEDATDDTLAESSDAPTRGTGKRDGRPSRSRVQSAVEVVEDQLGEEDTALQSKKKSVKKRPKRRPKRRQAEEEEEEKGTSGKAVSPPRPF